jgi:hypothetical protein
MENTRFFNTLLSSLKQRNKISRVRCSRCASNDAKSNKTGDLRFVSIADWRLQIADCGLRIADCGLQITDHDLQLLQSAVRDQRLRLAFH